MAVAQGEADATFMVAPALLPHVRSNKVRLLAVSSAQRPDSLEELPALAEAGWREVESLAWNGYFVPAGTPGLTIAAIPMRADPRDAFVGRTAKDLRRLAPGLRERLRGVPVLDEPCGQIHPAMRPQHALPEIVILADAK